MSNRVTGEVKSGVSIAVCNIQQDPSSWKGHKSLLTSPNTLFTFLLFTIVFVEYLLTLAFELEDRSAPISALSRGGQCCGRQTANKLPIELAKPDDTSDD